MITEHSYYNRFYQEDDSIVDSPLLKFVRNKHTEFIKRQIAMYRSPKLLSLGCGKGYEELQLAPFVESVIAIDISEIAIEQATIAALTQGVSNISFLTGDIREFDTFIKHQQFDVILASGILHHFSYDDIVRICIL